MRISVSNDKYTFELVNAPGQEPRIDVLRGGEPWVVDATPFNAIRSLMCELDAARVVIAAARDLGDDAPREIKQALEQHRALVDDRHRPSDWASPTEVDRV